MNITKPLGFFLTLFSSKEIAPKSADTAIPPMPVARPLLSKEFVVRTADEYVEWEDKFVKDDNNFFFAGLFSRANKKKQVCSIRTFETTHLKANAILSLPEGWQPFAVRTFHGGGSQGFARRCIDGE